MKKNFLILALTLCITSSQSTPASALTVACVNCSNNFTQMMDRVTNLEQLKSMMDSYNEFI